ncbi:Inositol-pentakisphosphate 2-kinase [Bienertia sinuspersici]
MELFLEEKDACDWTYRGEGAVNIVLVYSGSSPDFIGKVIRVQKVPTDVSDDEIRRSVLSKHECNLWKDVGDIVTSPRKDIAEQLYVQCVMVPLLGSEFVDPGVRILVSRAFLESVERNVLSQRPGWRVNAAKVDCCVDSVLLMSDHSIQQVSKYDPLDLFSGSRDRIDKAVKALLVNPQNNLRVFLNGSLICGSMGGGDHGTNFVKDEAIEDRLKSFIHAEYGLRTGSFIHLVREAIVKLGVIDRLLEVQKLDQYDVEGAIHAYYDIVSQPCKICRSFGECPQISSLHSIPIEESLKIVRDYLIAATTKDCSLMISFQPRQDDDPESHYRSIYLNSTNQRFDVKAFFIDLDMKPLEKMEFYYQLDQNIVNFYKRMGKVEYGMDLNRV